MTVRPFTLHVRGEDHHHIRTLDRNGRKPSDVKACDTFMAKSERVIAALMGGRYRPEKTPVFGSFRTLSAQGPGLPDIEIDIPLVRCTDVDLPTAVASAMQAGRLTAGAEVDPSHAERMADERYDAARAAIVLAVAEGSIPTEDPLLDNVWAHAATPWSRAVIHCRARKSLITSIPIDDGILHPAATLILDSFNQWTATSWMRSKWRMIGWASSMSASELPDPMTVLRSLARAG